MIHNRHGDFWCNSLPGYQVGTGPEASAFMRKHFPSLNMKFKVGGCRHIVHGEILTYQELFRKRKCTLCPHTREPRWMWTLSSRCTRRMVITTMQPCGTLSMERQYVMDAGMDASALVLREAFMPLVFHCTRATHSQISASRPGPRRLITRS